MQPKRDIQSGFTLLEVMIALAIFALVGLGAYRMLDVTLATQRALSQQDETLRQLVRSLHLLEADFSQVVERPVRGHQADSLPALQAPTSDYAIEFTRQGWRNPLQLPRSQLQRVAYELGHTPSAGGEAATGSTLLRHYWKVLDRAPDSTVQTQSLLSGVEALRIEFMDAAGDWHRQWPVNQPNSSDGLPQAIRVTLELASQGTVRRLFQIQSPPPVQGSIKVGGAP